MKLAPSIVAATILAQAPRPPGSWVNWKNCPAIEKLEGMNLNCKGRSCKLTCDKGYAIKGRKSVGCRVGDDGEFFWSKKIGKCITCPDFPESRLPEDLEVEYGVNPKGLKQVSFKCEDNANIAILTDIPPLEINQISATCRCNKKRCRYFSWVVGRYVLPKEVSTWFCLPQTSTTVMSTTTDVKENVTWADTDFKELKNHIDSNLKTCSSAENGFSIDERIVNGASANISDWSWIANLDLYSGHLCGGSAINDQWILTAAHCCAHGDGFQRTITASFFNHDYSYPEGSFEIPVAQIFNHPEYDPDGKPNMDFCLLKLDSPISTHETTKKVQFPCFPSSADIPHGENCWVAGWGTLDYGGELAYDLQSIGVHAMNQDYCKAKTQDDHGDGKLFPDDICAGNALDEDDDGLVDGGVDSCQGDSGGPLICPINGSATLLGIVSRGFNCAAPGYPGLYSNVHFALEWIEEIIEESGSPIPNNRLDKPDDATQKVNCSLENCPTWAEWGDWSECTADCDGGTTTRERDCKTTGKHRTYYQELLLIMSGRSDLLCDGEKLERKNCNTDPCV